MSLTLNEDGFADDVPFEHNYEPHSIVYGTKGWSDALSDETVAELVAIGAISLSQTYSGIGWEVKVYVSTKGAVR